MAQVACYGIGLKGGMHRKSRVHDVKIIWHRCSNESNIARYFSLSVCYQHKWYNQPYLLNYWLQYWHSLIKYDTQHVRLFTCCWNTYSHAGTSYVPWYTHNRADKRIPNPYIKMQGLKRNVYVDILQAIRERNAVKKYCENACWHDAEHYLLEKMSTVCLNP